ncbi:hypothetical protein BB559_005135 [Furculomyces boomerangus]|uniref:Proteinase inhibitor I78 n=2 Tax=Harpellales TaxID=61421 RepID=A0A2T9YAK1_9FUNG|nr:hypothetical protein BB559_005135 [Furculomyces boomerangus]PVZ97948.1 hypothetical protein BB558_006080 [Smittium angustum]
MFKFPSAEEIQLKTNDHSIPLCPHATEYSLDGIDPEQIVKLSSLPDPKRIICPGTPVTKDLRPGRLNVFLNSEGQILRVAYH